MTTTRASAVLFLSCVLWLLVISGGMVKLFKYETLAGSTGKTPDRWPTEFQIRREPGRATLLMFAHPQCPCTRASIGELARLMAQCPGQITAHVLFIRPSGFAKNWAQTDLWRSAAAIPGVGVGNDDQGMEAHRFGAETSGYVVLYDAVGKLIFHGGITGARGHAGDNAGRDAIVALLRGEEPAKSNVTPVFGCSLLEVNMATCGGDTACAK